MSISKGILFLKHQARLNINSLLLVSLLYPLLRSTPLNIVDQEDIAILESLYANNGTREQITFQNHYL